MTAPATTAEPAQSPDPNQGPAQTTRTLRLLGLVRRLITYGRDLTATLQRRPSAETALAVGLNFGIFSVAIILQRIGRALQLAEALETRLEIRAARPEPARPVSPPAVSAPAAPRKPRSPRAAPTQRPATLPTAEEIAEQLRRRPIHSVLAEICRDLGLGPSDPLWREVEDAIFELGGSDILFKHHFSRVRSAGMPLTWEKLWQAWEAPLIATETAATGPP